MKTNDFLRKEGNILISDKNYNASDAFTHASIHLIEISYGLSYRGIARVLFYLCGYITANWLGE